eukprot:TRINITY_DN3312_c0_g1_i2.p1 TRINITY_DN3312_c0_g1~~TRINITY_DN3312_c0_g1_i2.p1  ORF type:complete len:393 (-),score=93.63 TRINITY_DN3312_c0_g1_i2:97-1275(-)
MIDRIYAIKSENERKARLSSIQAQLDGPVDLLKYPSEGFANRTFLNEVVCRKIRASQSPQEVIYSRGHLFILSDSLIVATEKEKEKDKSLMTPFFAAFIRECIVSPVQQPKSSKGTGAGAVMEIRALEGGAHLKNKNCYLEFNTEEERDQYLKIIQTALSSLSYTTQNQTSDKTSTTSSLLSFTSSTALPLSSVNLIQTPSPRQGSPSNRVSTSPPYATTTPINIPILNTVLSSLSNSSLVSSPPPSPSSSELDESSRAEEDNYVNTLSPSSVNPTHTNTHNTNGTNANNMSPRNMNCKGISFDVVLPGANVAQHIFKEQQKQTVRQSIVLPGGTRLTATMLSNPAGPHLPGQSQGTGLVLPNGGPVMPMMPNQTPLIIKSSPPPESPGRPT